VSAQPDLRSLYREMCRMRYVEEAVAGLWNDALITGEMHLGVGEEATVAGVIAHLRPGDGVSVDYRSTPPFVAHGVDVEAILLELIGDPRGLDGGRAGHMHLLSPEHLAAASGIVGAPAPVACGLGLAAQLEGRGHVAVAFFGDGAVNEGMLMESLNLAAVWRLPVLFVCKDNRWAVTTRSRSVTAGGLRRRARGLGLPVVSVDGRDVAAVWRAAGRAVDGARRGHGPTFLVARVERLEGHFLGDPLVRVASSTRALAAEVAPLVTGVWSGPGAGMPVRLRALTWLTQTIVAAMLGRLRRRNDPLMLGRRRLDPAEAAALEQEARAEVSGALRTARGEKVLRSA
jgi:TPP-dependent pyruvate/acetoin dehydrogenase alpha subunit